MTVIERLRRGVAALTLLMWPVVLPAQATRFDVGRTMARADSAYANGERARASQLYAEVLAADSTQSRAVFRLAQLDGSRERSLVLYRQYVALEPGDPWGHMAEGDLLGRMGRWNDALQAYDAARALAPNERDVTIGRARLLDRSGHPDGAARELLAWTSGHPGDGEAWDLLGRAHAKEGRPMAAARAFERAAELDVPGAANRLQFARANSAPVIEPELASLGDSDGNRITRVGGLLDFMLLDGTRIGARLQRSVMTSEMATIEVPAAPPRPGPPNQPGTQTAATNDVESVEARMHLAARPAPGVNVSAQAGAARFESSADAAATWTTYQVQARLRAAAPLQGPSIELRAERAPLAVSPMLVASRVVRSEARALLEMPLAALRVRGIGRISRFDAPGEPSNTRSGGEAALVLPLGDGRVQPSLHYRVMGFQRPSTSGYFAPRLAEGLEAGLSLDGGNENRLSVAADVGAGMQRVAEHGGVTGPWARAFRLWGQAAVSLGPSRAWLVEVEAYDAPFALEGASSPGQWRYLSIASGLRWALR